MLLNLRSRSNLFGIVSVLSSVALRVYLQFSPEWLYVRCEVLLALFALAVLAALIAAALGSKMWLFALAGPGYL